MDGNWVARHEGGVGGGVWRQGRGGWGRRESGWWGGRGRQGRDAGGRGGEARCGPRDNPYVDVATDWVVMDAPGRLIYAETLSAEGDVLATSFATFELAADGAGTQLRVTIHIANFAGEGMLGEVESGWTHALDNLMQHV